MSDEKRTGLGSGAAMLLSAIFAFCMASVLLAGAGIYTKQTQAREQLWETRTAAQFLATRLRQAEAENLSVVDFGEGRALSIAEHSEYGDFETLVYCHEGMLRELFTVPGTGEPAGGEPVAPAEELSLTLSDGFVNIGLLDRSGQWTHLQVCIRGE